MSLQHAIHENILDNPISRLEFTTLKRQRGKWFWRNAFGLSLFVFLIPVLWGFGESFRDSLNFAITTLIFINFLAYILVAFKAIGTANDSTYRERRSKTWELLMLTGVSNWRMVFGKWLGVLRFLVRDFAWLFLLRFAVIFWGVIYYNLHQDFSYNCFSPYAYNFDPTCYPITIFNAHFGHEMLIFAIALTFLFTVLELLMSSAIGMATAFFNWSLKTGNGVAIGIRIGLGVVLPILVFFIFSFRDSKPFQRFLLNNYGYEETITPEQALFIGRTTTIFSDNGMVTVFYLFEPNFTRYPFYISTTLIGIGMYLAVTAASLFVAANRASVRGVNRLGEGDYLLVKSKRKKSMPVSEKTVETPIKHSNALVIPHSSGNIFQLENSESRIIEIYHYQRRLGRMILRISGADDNLYLQLSNVVYMEAPAFWKGAMLQTASQAEYRAFLSEKSLSVNSLAQESMRLYLGEGVRIVAGAAEYLDELPANI